MDKAVVLIDGGYFDAINRNHFGKMRIDMLKLSETLCEPDCERFRTYYYNCPPWLSEPPLDSEIRFMAGYRRYTSKLDELPRFVIREGVLKKSGSAPPTQKLVDVWFACDLVRLSASKKIEKAIIIAGDADYVPAVKIAIEEHVITKLVYFPRSCSRVLRKLCDEREKITQDLMDACVLDS